MKIYTKGGDTGTTALWGGKRVSKDSSRIDAYGTLDELNVHIGIILDETKDSTDRDLLVEIQIQLFTFGAHLAADPEKKGLKLPLIEAELVLKLETAIDAMEEDLPQLTAFILPGGHDTVSKCHLGRVVCRRAERLVVSLNNSTEINPGIIIYLNRLSDYLFVLGRKWAHNLNIKELPWKPKY